MNKYIEKPTGTQKCLTIDLHWLSRFKNFFGCQVTVICKAFFHFVIYAQISKMKHFWHTFILMETVVTLKLHPQNVDNYSNYSTIWLDASTLVKCMFLNLNQWYQVVTHRSSISPSTGRGRTWQDRSGKYFFMHRLDVLNRLTRSLSPGLSCKAFSRYWFEVIWNW